jgi:8-oxo-dGTP pyrophosphatase MutT (NUDIX family)
MYVNNISIERIRSIVTEYQRKTQNTPTGGTRLIEAAVLVPVVREGDALSLILTRRTDSVETHKGQIAFPGGIVDAEDRDRVHTALREAEEELGILPSAVEPVGLLDDLVTPTGFCITPVVGILQAMPPLDPNPGEVAEAFTVPLVFFADPRNAQKEYRTVGSTTREVWTYVYDGRIIWGATGTIIHRMMTVLNGL